MMERRLYRAEGFGLAAKLRAVSWLYVGLLAALAGVGYVALYSAGGGPLPFANRHALRFALGLAILIATALTDLRLIRRLAWPLYGLGIALLLAVARFGHVGKGAQRWIEIGAFQLQPSELMKIFLVLALASWFHRASFERIGNPFFLIPPALATAIPVALILKQPNLGTAVITALVAGAVFFAAGVRWWKFALVALAIGAAAPLAYHHLHDYQRARIETFLHPESDPLGTGYNIIQSKIALGSGGLWGKGFLHGTQGHLDFLPEKQTDFIFTVLAEEFGLVGALALLGLITLIIAGGLVIALRAREPFARLLAIGITVNYSLYVFVNLAMVMGAIPVGGVPLPLISHGGSALLTAMFGFGLLLSVEVHRDVSLAHDPDAI
ncbi:MAG: rod shape-determining protein RodA [Acidibrevibacterium sp.]|jgi:rod shape determining protein RodA|uniref:rod shape-determining protein RodA n=1 Tax=Acidibrevibacterium fodinaquatile TaxID=1969806 RepID=UPI000E0D937F|nr:rod shape-determining protein RodA [Acidibrevibacterium fodinaquatile]MCA7119880.1 rod shape-determining protein RodA [Acidibrevibacterium fodinaquatile]